MRNFDSALAQGRVAEGLIAEWLKHRGCSIMPAYEIEKSRGKGPQLFSVGGDFVAPDMLVFNHNGICWVEAKHKSVFTWHRNSKKWTTGIDLRHYSEYHRVAYKTKLPVWLLFFHREHEPDFKDKRHGCPSECPTGLFGGELVDLLAKENHRSPHFDPDRTGMTGHGASGMVYWAVDQLRHLASKEEVISIATLMSKKVSVA